MKGVGLLIICDSYQTGFVWLQAKNQTRQFLMRIVSFEQNAISFWSQMNCLVYRACNISSCVKLKVGLMRSMIRQAGSLTCCFLCQSGREAMSTAAFSEGTWVVEHGLYRVADHLMTSNKFTNSWYILDEMVNIILPAVRTKPVFLPLPKLNQSKLSMEPMLKCPRNRHRDFSALDKSAKTKARRQRR